MANSPAALVADGELDGIGIKVADVAGIGAVGAVGGAVYPLVEFEIEVDEAYVFFGCVSGDVFVFVDEGEEKGGVEVVGTSFGTKTRRHGRVPAPRTRTTPLHHR